MASSDPVVEAADVWTRGIANSATLAAIRRDVYGADYPEEAQPSSFVTNAELELVSSALRSSKASTLVDLGCGTGGLGLLVARSIDAQLVGIDLSPAAVELAAERAASLGLARRARFIRGDFTATGLPSQRFEGAVGFDTLIFAQDLGAALQEVHRILRPGGRLAFTAVESPASEPAGKLETLIRRQRVSDYRPLLDEAGFEVETYQEPPRWRERQLAFYREVTRRSRALHDELGARVADGVLTEAATVAPQLPDRRRVLAIAQRR
jgi:SAM-dependent methyltransferase